MRDFLKRLNLSAIAIAVCAGALVVGVSAGAEARDDHWRDHRRHHDHDRYDRHDRRDRHVYHHYRNERPVIVDRRPVVVAPPVYQMPAYQAAPSGLNLNFIIPLQ